MKEFEIYSFHFNLLGSWLLTLKSPSRKQNNSKISQARLFSDEESEEQAAGHPKRVCDRAARRETQNVVKPCSVGTERVPMR